MSLALSPRSPALLCVYVCMCACSNLHVCKKTSVLLCSTLCSYCKLFWQKNDGNILIFVGEKCECITLVSSVHPFYGGNQMYVENKVVYIYCEGPASHRMAELYVQRSVSVKICEEIFAK